MYQLVVRTALDYAAVVEYDYHVGLRQRGYAVGYDEGGYVCLTCIQRFAYGRVGFGIDRAERVVEYQYVVFLAQRARTTS